MISGGDGRDSAAGRRTVREEKSPPRRPPRAPRSGEKRVEEDCHCGFLRCRRRRRGEEHGGAAAGIVALIDLTRFHASRVAGWHKWRLRSAHFSSYAVRFVHASYLSVLRAPQHGCGRSTRAAIHEPRQAQSLCPKAPLGADSAGVGRSRRSRRPNRSADAPSKCEVVC